MPLRLCVLDTTLCDKVYQWLPTGQWFSPGTPVSSINKTDRHDITAILLKVAFQKPTVCTKLNIYDFIIGRQIELESRRLMFDGHLNRWTVNYGQYFQSLKGILSTTIVIFSYPKLLSFSVLTFIKWRLNTELLANTLRNVVFSI
jgi:hypothetical protein